MKYSIIIGENETHLLKSLIGQTIDEVQIPGIEYSIRLLCGKNTIDFSPEEFSTPEKDNQSTSVTRPTITNDCSRVTFDETKTIANNYGVIKSIHVLRTTVIFSPRTPVESTLVGKIEIPTTYGWNNILISPDNFKLKELEGFSEKALVNLDIGFLVKTTNWRKLYINTDGYSYWVTRKFGWSFPNVLKGKVKCLSIQ